jgi:hypothetical protein
MVEVNPWAQYIADTQAQIDNIRKNIARDQALLAAGQGDPRTLNLQIQGGLDRIVALQQLIDTVYQPNFDEWQTSRLAPPVSAGGIVGNANQARDENASATLPVTGAKVLAFDGRIQPAGSGPNGAGQISGTNATETPTQQNNPTVGTNTETRPISQTQAINNQDGQLVPVPNTQPLVSTQASVRAIDNAIAATGSPGAGAGADAGGITTKGVSPFPQYRARTQSYVYLATTVTSVFKQGKFEQALHGTLYTQLTANTTQTNAQQRQETTSIKPVTSVGATVVTRPPTTIGDLPVKQQAAIAAGTDPNTVNDQGMAFGGGGL